MSFPPQKKFERKFFSIGPECATTISGARIVALLVWRFFLFHKIKSNIFFPFYDGFSEKAASPILETMLHIAITSIQLNEVDELDGLIQFVGSLVAID